MRQRRALTLLEVVVAVAIIVIVAAIVAPVYGNARHSAKVASASEQLRQIHRLVTLYRADWEVSVYGSPNSMGMPPPTRPEPLQWLPMHMWRSPCGTHPMERRHYYDYFNVWLDEQRWGQMVQQLGEASPMVIDQHCTDHSLSLTNQFVTHFGLAVRLDGAIARRRKVGLPTDLRFWGYVPNPAEP